CLRICSEENRWAKKQSSKQANEKSLTTFNAAAICFASLPMARYALARRRIAARFTANCAVRLNLFLIAIAAPRAVRAPIEMLVHSYPERRYLLLVISVTGVISVGVDNLEPVLHQAEEFVERFHQRVMLLFARLAVGVSAAFLLELFDGGLNLRVLLLNQNAERK